VLTCIPRSIWTWNFDVVGASAGPASIAFNFFTEQGTISLGDSTYEIEKQGMMSGHWTLENSGQVVASAQKSSPFLRAFELSAGDAQFLVKAQSPFVRTFEIMFGGCVIGTIRPIYFFARKTELQCEERVPELVQLFSFWLAALTWRRAAKNSNTPTVGVSS
jgi:hypothetical protein